MLCHNQVFYQYSEVTIIIIIIDITVVPGNISIAKFFWKAYGKEN